MDAIRITRSSRIEATLRPLRSLYPTLSDAEIFKLSLAEMRKETTNRTTYESPETVLRTAAWVMNQDGWLDDPGEDIYTPGTGKPIKW